MPCKIKGLASAHTRLYSLCKLLQTDRECCVRLKTSILSITGIQTPMYTRKLCVKCHAHEFFDCLEIGLLISRLGKFLLKLRADHSGKLAPREINSLYGSLFLIRQYLMDVATFYYDYSRTSIEIR